MSFMAPGAAADGSTLLDWRLPPELLDSTVQIAISAFAQTYQRINKVMGWGKLKHDLWKIKLQKIYKTKLPTPACRIGPRLVPPHQVA